MYWFQAVMRVCTTKLIKMIVGPKALGERPPSTEEVRNTLDEFFKNIVPVLNKRVSQNEYMCGDYITAADIMIYNELKTVLVLHKKEVTSKDTPNLYSWFTRI